MSAAAFAIAYRFKQLGGLAQHELDALARMVEPAVEVPRRATIRMEGDPVACLWMLHSGWVASSTARHDGGRLLLKVQLPGDMLGAASLAQVRAAETLTALTPVTMGRIPLSAIGDMFVNQPRLAAMFFLNGQLERVGLSDRIASIGRSSADSSVASFLLQLFRRLETADPHQPRRFDLPLTLEDIGDSLGLTPVHVSRTLTKLAAAGLIARRGRSMELLDLERLGRMAGTPERPLARDLEWLPPSSPPPSAASSD